MQIPRILLGLTCVLLTAAAAPAESRLELGVPAIYETVPAATYDNSGRRIGRADLVIEKLPNGNVQITSDSGFERGERTRATAVLESIRTSSGEALRLALQTSESFDASGQSIGTLRIDHDAGTATCATPTATGATKVEHLPLPSDDRVVNVPFNLLFMPLVKGETESLRFQLFLCRKSPHFLDFEAKIAGVGTGESKLIEVRYTPDLGSVLSIVAQGFVPNLAFWFDPAAENPYVAHRMPLYSSGPEITVLRDGVPFPELTIEN